MAESSRLGIVRGCHQCVRPSAPAIPPSSAVGPIPVYGDRFYSGPPPANPYPYPYGYIPEPEAGIPDPCLSLFVPSDAIQTATGSLRPLLHLPVAGPRYLLPDHLGRVYATYPMHSMRSYHKFLYFSKGQTKPSTVSSLQSGIS